MMLLLLVAIMLLRCFLYNFVQFAATGSCPFLPLLLKQLFCFKYKTVLRVNVHFIVLLHYVVPWYFLKKPHFFKKKCFEETSLNCKTMQRVSMQLLCFASWRNNIAFQCTQDIQRCDYKPHLIWLSLTRLDPICVNTHNQPNCH